MSEPTQDTTDLRARLRDVFVGTGTDAASSDLHSWRCAHPELLELNGLSNPCRCFDDLLDDLVAAVPEPGHEPVSARTFLDATGNPDTIGDGLFTIQVDVPAGHGVKVFVNDGDVFRTTDIEDASAALYGDEQMFRDDDPTMGPRIEAAKQRLSDVMADADATDAAWEIARIIMRGPDN